MNPPPGQSRIKLRPSLSVPRSEQLQTSAKVVVEALEDADCHLARFTFRIVDG
jgi:hypothetical protein